jgi:2-polyprenyl-3-methyl-5-hydroxy-6-metoxy-1,4-benzoquinol methylase
LLGSSIGDWDSNLNNEKRLVASRQYWDNLASSFDDEPDHGLRDPVSFENWSNFLHMSLPYSKATILDIGCGTGSLSIVLAGFGHKVTGIDLSPAMISIAQNKATKLGFEIEFHVKDAASLQLLHEQFDAIVCRHLLWALPEPRQVLQRWAEFLKPNGRLILIEGYWDSGGGLHANEIIEILPSCFEGYSLHNLAENPDYWGKRVSDERYAIIADKK